MPITYYPTFKNSSGNVGIGNINPSYRLDIKAATTNGSTVFVIRNANDANNLAFYDNGTASAGSDFRAPIFYDSNNTSYYLDAANSGTSLLVAGNVGIGNTSPSAKLHVSGASYTTASAANNNVRFEGGGGNGLGFGTIDATSTYASWIQSGYVPNFATATYALLLNPLGGNVGIGTTSPNYKLDVNGTFRTATNNLTIFNDYLYVSPTENNTFNSAYSTNGIADMWINYAGYNNGNTQFRNFNVGNGKNGIIAWFDGTNKRVSINNSQAASYPLHVVGTAYSDTDFRAPIFYDSNNTVYYLDPASTSVINRIDLPSGSAAINTTTPGTSAYQLNFTGQSTVDNAQAITWGWSTSGAQAGIYVQSSGGYGTKMYIATTDSFATGSKTALTIDHNGIVTTNRNYLQATGSLRAPIFYDSDNTAYYIDAASGSNLNTLTLNGILTTVSSGTAINFSGQSDSIGYNATSGQGTYIKGTGTTYIYGGGVFFDGSAIRTLLHSNNYGGYSAFSGSVTSTYGNFASPGLIMGDAQYGFYVVSGNVYYKSASGGVHYWRNIANSANTMSLDNSGSLNLAADVRAPIFYDSNDTNYYVDPASTTNLLTLSVNRINNLRPYVDTWHTSTDGTRRFFFANGGTTYYSTANNYVFRNASDVGVVTIDSVGNLRTSTSGDNYASYSLHVGGTGYATADFRSPIFYDSNNTAYYVDPASTSVLNRLTIDGGNYANNYFQSLSDFTNGTLVTTDIPATAANGLSFVMNVVGKSYNTTTSPFNFSVQGYLYNSTIINYSGMSLDSSGLSTIKIFENGGFLCFWWARVSYWNAFEVSVRSYDTTKTNYNRVTNITDAVEPTGTKKVTVTLQSFLRADVSATNAVDLRAPIFYDSNNTAFYCDPTATSNFTGLTVANTITGSVSGNAGTATILQTARNINGTSFNGSAAITTATWGTARTLTIGSTGKSIDGSAGVSWSLAEIGALPLSGGQITGNTTFSADNHLTFGPNSTWGSSIRIGGNGYTATGTETASVVTTDGNLHLDAAKSTNGIYLNWYGGTSGVFFGNGSSGQVAFVSNTGNASFSGVVDATQFRDASNTAYYVDPASSSNLNNLTVAGTMTFGTLAYVTESRRSKNSSNVDIETVTGLVSPSGPTFLEIRGFCPPTMFRTTGDRPAPYGLGFGNGAESGGIMPIGAGDNLQEIMLYGSNTGPTTFTFKRQNWEGSTYDPSNSNSYSASVFSINTGTGVVTASTDIRAPIFYDSNDTTYYTDPSSLSNILELKTNKNWYDSSASAWGGGINMGGNNPSIGFQSTASTWWYMLHHSTNDINFYRRSTSGGWNQDAIWHDSGYLEWITDSVRAAIFYDRSNTSYYCDPASTSNLVGLTVANTITGSVSGSSASCTGNSATTTLATKATRANGDFFIDDNYGNTVVGLYSATRLQGVFAMGNSYKLTADGTGVGTLYGLAWSHPNFGGVAANLADHGLLILQNGVFKGAWGGGSLRTPGDVRGTLFYDWDNTAYYCDPASTSNLNAITAAGNITAVNYYTSGWFRNSVSGNGLYNESTGEHFYSDAADMWNVASANGTQGIRLRTGGHNGTVRGYFYGNDSNDVGFLNNAGNWRLRIVGGDYALFDGSSIRGQIFFDTNDTSYYCDPAGTSNFSTLSLAGTLQFAGNINWNHGVTAELGRKTLGFNIWQGGKKLNADEDFNSGNNGISVYNNSGGTALTITRTALATAPNSSGQVLRVAYTPGSNGTSPGFGGFFFATQTAANEVFVTRFVANIPTGRSLDFHSNSYGTNSNAYWLTNNAGTGKWEEYVFVVMCGNTGTFSSTNFFAISGGANTAFSWDIASATVFDITNKYETVSRVLTADSFVSSPIYYDQNNTAYFIDAASTSNLVGLTVANTITGSITGNAGGSSASCTGNAATATILQTARNINGTSFNGSAAITTATWGTARTITIGSTGKSVDGSANVSWSLAELGAAATNQTMFIGTTSVAINRASASQTLTGVSIDGNSATVTNGMYTSGDQNITGAKYFTSNKGATSTVGANNTYSLEAFSGDGGAAGMSFHRGGYYAVNMGLDPDNVLRIGGWSASANRLQLDMSGNLTLAGVVDATQFRDSNNTAYYIDAASTSNLAGLTVANTITGSISGSSGSCTGNAANVTGTVAVANGGTGATSAAAAATNLGLGTGNTPKFLNVYGERAAVTSASSTTVNTQYNVTELTMSASITTLTLSNIQASAIVHMWTIVTVGNGTTYSITWPAAIKWPGGTAPTITATNAKRDIYQFVTYDGGTNIYAIIVGQNL